MPLIEELPQAKNSKATPGWAYVAEPSSLDPSKAPIIPTNTRKRAARSGPVAATGELSARQQSKIQQHLANLDRENNKDVQIALPNRPREIAARGLRGKMTPGVKKILLSQKTFANHLADEEAMIALEQDQAGHSRGVKAPGPKSKRASLGRVDTAADPMEVDSPAHRPEQSAVEADPLLELHGPTAPMQLEIDELVKTPPLSYNAARAAPSSSTAPARVFCEICGYWGRARCMKCGASVCGLHCKTQHEETNCAKFWA